MAQVLITGANRGIGLGLARFFLEAGNDVLATARNPDQSEALVALKEAFPTNLQIECLDVGSDLSVTALAAQWGERPLDILINNAGILKNEAEAGVEHVEIDAIQASMQVNVYGVIRMCKAFYKNLLAAEAPKIINMSSKVGSIGDNTSGGLYAYRMSKTALNMFHKSLSIDVPQVTSIAFHPGWVQTDMGGSSATVSIEDSTNGLGQLILEFNNSHSGGFYDFAGNEIPW